MMIYFQLMTIYLANINEQYKPNKTAIEQNQNAQVFGKQLLYKTFHCRS